jgi:hypothetical protein
MPIIAIGTLERSHSGLSALANKGDIQDALLGRRNRPFIKAANCGASLVDSRPSVKQVVQTQKTDGRSN